MWLRRVNLGLETVARNSFHAVGATFIGSIREPALRGQSGVWPLTRQLTAYPRTQMDRVKVSRGDSPIYERRNFSGTRWSLSAIRPNSGSERAFIFRIALLRWTFTVVSAMPMSPAICLLRRPRAT
jgi:hypothetical protein